MYPKEGESVTWDKKKRHIYLPPPSPPRDLPNTALHHRRGVQYLGVSSTGGQPTPFWENMAFFRRLHGRNPADFLFSNLSPHLFFSQG